MSLRALTWAIYDIAPNLTDASAYRILLVLADEADNDGRGVYLSSATIAERTGLSQRTVATKLKELEAMGIIRRGDQNLVAYLPANRRPVVRDLNMTPEARGAKTAPQNTQPEPNPEPADADMQQGCNRGATDMQQGCNMVAHNPLNPYNPFNPREAARETVDADQPSTPTHSAPKPTAGTEAALAVWQPNHEARTLADEAHADLIVEAEKFRCRQLADGKIAKNLDAAFVLWLRRGIEGGYLTPAHHERPSDTRPTKQPTAHRHAWDCQHVQALMTPHEADYDHTRHGWGASDWMLACQAEADRLNREEGLTDPDDEPEHAALAEGDTA
ncbi:helix-turn-helix domain-containing protein [Bifidobacterium sp. AGR2158]|uniref:helix-turn-helix domain-containing protein n=1 Tax=Bifidobacterium sp. AGR2158 TaxID=1280675 RepID=UPI0004063516|nr:helix-turn-helix domain-containing protein [Bifidobacterium sp. AGR2158]